ncbi:Ly6/PLAUR domain-containing protein 6, partial [Frankliniella fusca]
KHALRTATATDDGAKAAPDETFVPCVLRGKLTCFTCSNVTDNDQCNRYAIDRPCEPGLSLCRTDHVIERVPNSRARSLRISKSCVSAEECSRATVGCRGVAGAGAGAHQRVCTSCCDWSYCNELAPADTLTAVLALSRSGAAPHTDPAPLAAVLLAVLSAVF